jgi:hypothetical protein
MRRDPSDRARDFDAATMKEIAERAGASMGHLGSLFAPSIDQGTSAACGNEDFARRAGPTFVAIDLY